MFIKKPRLSVPADSETFCLLVDALSQYYVHVGRDDLGSPLSKLPMDDLDFLEALQLVEDALNIRIDKARLSPSTSLAELVVVIDECRSTNT